MTRALIIGAGIVGAASAFRLAERGVQVTVLERGRIGDKAASTAAAGMLGAQIEAHPVEGMQALCVASRALYPEFVAAVSELGGIDVELRPTGALRVAYDAAWMAELEEDVAEQRRRGLEAEILDAEAVARLEPALAPTVGAARYRADGVVEPRDLLAATCAAARAKGAVFEESCEVLGLSFDPSGAIDGVELAEGPRRADVVVLAAGSWSSRIRGLDGVLPPSAVEPVRGQMIEIHCEEPPLRGIVSGPDAYLSPRLDGRLLVGSTVEHVGFRHAVTLGALGRLSSEAVRMVPALEAGELRRTWSGLRASTPDGLPIFGRRDKLVVATGHYRNGIVLAPITAEIVTALVTGATQLPFDVAPFSLERLEAGGLKKSGRAKNEEAARGHVS
jgi:glycine oxidase